MEEMMLNGANVNEEVSDENNTQETTSGPSKGFVAVVVGGLLALGTVVGLAIWNHKKNKAVSEESEEDSHEDSFSEENSEIVPEEDQESEEK